MAKVLLNMNIFFLHLDPQTCAQYHLDAHVIKMILETCQLLCSAIIHTGQQAPYKLTHYNHPSAIWTRQSKSNWLWLYNLGLELCKEYSYRYNRTHKCEPVLRSLKCPPLDDIGFTTPPQAMPMVYQEKDDFIQAYRNYYLVGKIHLHAWKKRSVPHFVKECFPHY